MKRLRSSMAFDEGGVLSARDSQDPPAQRAKLTGQDCESTFREEDPEEPEEPEYPEPEPLVRMSGTYGAIAVCENMSRSVVKKT